MAEAKLYGQNKGGMSINGIIKDYYAYAGEKISAGDLVEYVNGVAGKVDIGTSVDTSVRQTDYAGYIISAVALDENSIFIAHSRGSYYHLYGIVIKIDGANISFGNDTVIGGSTDSGKVISTCLLANGNVFIAHSYGANHHLYGVVVSIDGTEITVGSDTILNNNTTLTGDAISTCLLSNGNVFIAHKYGSSQYLYGIVCTISGTTITKGTDTALVSSSKAGYAISTCLLPNGKVFIAHSCNSNTQLHGLVVSISDKTISIGTDTTLSTAGGSGYTISTCLLANGNVFIANSNSGSYFLDGIVVTINGTTITAGTKTSLNSGINTGKEISTLLLTDGKVLLIHGYDNYQCLYAQFLEIDGTTITSGTTTEILTNSFGWGDVSAILLNNGNVFIAHSHTINVHYLYAQIFTLDKNNVLTNNISITEYETQVRQVTTGRFYGVAKTSGIGGDNTGHKDIVSIWTMQGILPDGYTKVEYIQSSGTQYINTGVVVEAGTGYEIEFALVSTTGETGIIGGFNYGGYNHNFAAYGDRWITQYGNNQAYQFGQADIQWHTLSQNVENGVVKFDNEVVQTGLNYYDNPDRTFNLFCYNGGASYPTFWMGASKISSCKMYNSAKEIVRDYIPCINPSGEVGLYDIVNSKFYGNLGTGTFVAG